MGFWFWFLFKLGQYGREWFPGCQQREKVSQLLLQLSELADFHPSL